MHESCPCPCSQYARGLKAKVGREMRIKAWQIHVGLGEENSRRHWWPAASWFSPTVVGSNKVSTQGDQQEFRWGFGLAWHCRGDRGVWSISCWILKTHAVFDAWDRPGGRPWGWAGRQRCRSSWVAAHAALGNPGDDSVSSVAFAAGSFLGSGPGSGSGTMGRMTW